MQLKDLIPLAIAQQDIYLHQIQHPNNPMYNIGGILKLTDIEPFKLQCAHKSLIENHENFGLRIVETDDGPMQFISCDRTLELTLVDFSNLENAQENAQHWVEENFQIAFHLYNSELYKSYLIKLSENNYWYCFVAHHLMIDGWGFAKLIESLGGYYSGSDVVAKSQWREIVESDIRYLQSNHFKKDKDYWERQLTNFPEPMLNPYYRNYYQDQKCIPSGRKSMTIPSDKYNILKNLLRELGVGPAQFFLALISVYFCRAYCKEQVLVGLPVHNRKRYDDKQHIGLFTSVSPMLVEISNAAQFANILQQVSQRQRQNFRHQKYPFGELVRRLGGKNHSGAALEIEFNYLKLKSSSEIGDGSASVHYLSHHHNPIPFSLTVWEFGDSQPVELHMDFNKAFFTDKEASLMLSRFYSTVLQFMAKPQLRVCDFSLLPPKEQAMLYRFSQGLEVAINKESIHLAFERQAKSNPMQTALVFESQSMSYGQLQALTNQLAQYLLEQYRDEKQVFIGVSLERSFDLVVSILATLKAGFAYVPLDPVLPKSRLAYIAADTQLACILTVDKFHHVYRDISSDVVLLDDECIQNMLKQFAVDFHFIPSHRALAYVIYTSGTTGNPKGVAVEHMGVLNRLEWGQNQYQLSSQDVVLQKTPFSFDVSVWEIFWPLRQGATLVLAKPDGHKDPSYLHELIQENQITVAQFVPSMLEAYQQIQAGPMPASLRYLFCSGEALGIDEVRRIHSDSPHIQVFNLYGPTEAAIEVSHFACAQLGKRKSMPIGNAIQNTVLYVLNANLELCPIGVVGELYIGGICLARGYHNLDALTEQNFIEVAMSSDEPVRLYKTGDLARYAADGYIEYLGRNDHQVKIRGLRIELTEIEAVLNGHANIRRALVSASQQNTLVAYIQLDREEGLHENEQISQFRTLLSHKLPSYMVPEQYVILTEWPKTVSGKIDRKALPVPERQVNAQYEAPQTPEQHCVVDTVAQLLGLDVTQVSVTDNFFALGGHSLLAVRLAAEVRRALGKALSVQAIFNAVDLRALAQVVARSEDEQASTLVAIPREQSEYPLSYAQQRLWFIDHLQGDSREYNMAAAFDVHGVFDVDLAEQALAQVIARHEVLRTVFIERDGHAWQQVQDAVNFRLAEHDIQALDASEQALAVAELIASDKQRPFDLSQDLMLRGAYIHVAAKQGVLLLNLHHIAGDGWSIPVLVKEFEQGYEALQQGTTLELSPLPVQYIDYAHWQRGDEQQAVFAQQLSYWQTQLAGAPTVHDLPLAHARTASAHRAAALCVSEVPASVYQQLNQVASEQGMSAFMLLHSVLALVLSRHSHSHDIVVGTPVANRQHGVLKDLIGFFVNTVVLRLDTQHNHLADYWAHVREVHLAAQSHQDVPFEQVVEHCCDSRSQTHSPLFQISFDMQFADELRLSLADVQLQRRVDDAQALKFELEITAHVSDTGLQIEWWYDSHLFAAEQIEQLSRHFSRLVSAVVVSEPEQCALHALNMLSSAEQSQLLSLGQYHGEYVETEAVRLTQTIAQQAFRTPHAIAVQDSHNELSYQALEAQANQLAHYLIAQGVQQGDVIGVYLPRSVLVVVSMLAIWKVGGTVLSLDPQYPHERVQFMLDDAQARQVLSLEDEVRFSHVECLVLSDTDWQNAPSDIYIESGTLSDIAYLIYTSGSTGQPKGVAVSHKAIAQHIHGVVFEYALSAADKAWQLASFSFDTALEQSFAILSCGGCVMLHQGAVLSAEAWHRQMCEQAITLTDLPVAYFAQLLNQLNDTQWHTLGLRLIVVGGEALPRQVVTNWLAKGMNERCRLVNAYGPTEAVITASYQDIDIADSQCVRIGRALPGRQLYVLDSERQLTPMGCVGELYIGGLLAQGYWRQARLSADKFISSPWHDGERLYRTGDKVRWLDSGALVFEGRLDEQVKRRGYRIELGEIEYHLSQLTGVDSALVLLSATEQLVGYVVAQTGHSVDEHTLQEALQTQLPSYMVPEQYVILTEWPKTVSGKIDRKALPVPERQVNTQYEAPQTPEQHCVVDTVAQLLGLDVTQVSVTDNFFALGGHSLLAVRLAAEVRRALGKALSVQAIFNAVDLRALAQVVARSEDEQASTLVAIPRAQSEYPLSYAQQRLWFIDHLQGDSREYNMAAAFDVHGVFDVDLAEQALAQVIARHEVLRTVFIERDGHAWQQVQDAVNFRLAEHDIQALDASEQALAVAELIASDKQRPFDLSQDLMLRGAYIHVAAKQGVLLLNLHHIAGDGWSIPVLVKEFEHGYEALQQGTTLELSPLPVQYIDYAHWQRGDEQQAVFAQQLSYWQTQLAGAPTVHDLPLAHARTASAHRAAALCVSEVPASVYQQLNQVASEQGMSAFMLLHSVLALVLSRHSHSHDIVVGTPVANRQHGVLKDLIGFFVNTVVLRLDTQHNHLADYWAHVREVHLAAQSHQDVPFEQVVEHCCDSRSQTHSPLFQISFDMQFADELRLSLADVQLQRRVDDAQALKFELEITAHVSDTGLQIEWWYDSHLFAAEQIEQLSRHFSRLVSAVVVSEPEQCALHALNMLSSAEQSQLLSLGQYHGEYVETEAVRLTQTIAQQAFRTPHAIAVQDSHNELSYQALEAQANQLAHYLIAQGVQQGDVIGVYLPRSVLVVVSMLAIWKVGGTVLSLDPQYPHERVQFMLDDAQARQVLSLEDEVRFSHVECLVLSDTDWQNAPSDIYIESGTLSDIAYLIYTSGSTGQPKGVAVSHKAIAQHIHGVVFEYALSAADKAWQLASFSFDTALEQSFAILSCGGCVMLHQGAVLSAEAWHRQMCEQAITLTDLPVAYFAQLLNQLNDTQWHTLGLRLIVVGGEALPRQVVTNWLAKGMNERCRLVNAYGPTEAVITASYQDIDIADSQCVRIGRALPGRQLYVLDSERQLTPMGCVGELYIGGLLAQGYWRQARLSADKFISSPWHDGERLYRTGDKVRWLDSGALVFEGRLDEQVKRRGYRIELGEIEYHLSQLTGVDSALVLLSATEQLVGYVVAQTGHSVDEHTLQEALQTQLPSYMVPEQYVILTEWPKTVSGKIDRKALPVPERQVNTQYEAPQTPEQHCVVDTVAQLLGLDVTQVSVTDNFFALGGHSLLAVRLAAEVRRALGKALSVQAIFNAVDLRALAQVVARSEDEQASTLVAIPRAQSEYPLSYAQQRLWFIDHLQGDSREYNMAAAFDVHGVFDVDLAEQALAQVIARHEVLRTVFIERDGHAWQQVQDAVNFRLAEHDIQALDASEQALAVAELIASDKQRPFDLSQDLMLRGAYIHVAAKQGVLLLNLHHIAGDGWSIPVLVKEFEQGYEALQQGTTLELSPLPVQYIDYAHWQRGDEQQAVFAQQLSYWQTQLAGAPTVHDLPLAHARTASAHRAAALCVSEVPASVYQQLNQVASEQGMSAFMLLHSVLALVLSRHSHSHDIVVGTPVANRQHGVLKDLIGFFVNTVVLRLDTQHNHLADYWAHVREVHLAAQSHQDVPFEQVVEHCCDSRSQTHSPLFQISFDMQFADELRLSLADVQLQRRVDDAQALKFELEITAHVSDTGLQIEWWYDSHLFAAEQIEQLSRHFSRLVSAVVASEPEQCALHALNMLSSAEQSQLLSLGQYHGEYQSPTQCIHQLFEQQVNQTPNNTAIVFCEQTLSYEELNKQANRVAHYLHAQGVTAHKLVGVCTPRCPEMMVAILAILKLGAAYVPLDPDYPRSRLELIVKDAELQLVLCTTETVHALPSELCKFLDVQTIDSVLLEFPETNLLDVHITTNSPAYVNYTSGTTGKPKGVIAPHRGVCRLVRSANFAELNAQSCVVHFASISFDAATFELWGPLLNGGRCVFYPESVMDLASMNALLAQHSVDTLFMTTGLFNQWSYTHPELPQLKRILVGGEVADKHAVSRMLQALPTATVVNVYGPTENTTFSSYYEVPRARYENNLSAPALPIGKSITGTELFVVAPDGSLSPKGCVGELLTGGDGVALGYLKQSTLSEERFIPNTFTGIGRLYKTGDLVRFNDQDELDYIGRIDNQIKLRGFRIELGEIEQVLAACPQVDAALVQLYAGDDDVKQLVAYMTVAIDAKHLSEFELIDAVRMYLTSKLPQYMMPAIFMVVEQWPLTATGKVDKAALPRPSLAHLQTEFVDATTTTEHQLRCSVAKLLALDESQISITANFFDLGGHSLLAIRLVSEIDAAMGKHIAVKAIFDYPILAELAQYIEQTHAVSMTEIPKANRDEVLFTSYAQQRLWFIDHMQGGTSEYNICEAVELHGKLDETAVRQALLDLVVRHEVIRTNYQHAGATVHCVVRDVDDVLLSMHDLRSLDLESQKIALGEYVMQLAQTPFDLACDLMLKVVLVKCSSTRSVLIWSMHHIATDGWSLSLLIKEFSNLYNSYISQQSAQLPSLNLQYVDFAQWQRAQFASDAYQNSIAFWQQHLAAVPDVHGLVLDYPRPAKQQFQGAVYRQHIDSAQLKRLYATAKQHQVTLYMLIKAAFSVVLSRFSGETDIVIGTPVAGREHAALEGVVGLFVNTLVSRTDLSSVTSFTQLLAQVKAHTLASYAHQEVPFDAIVEALNPERSSAYNPLCQIKFVLQNFESDSLSLSNVIVKPYQEAVPVQVHFDLDLTGTEYDEQLELEWSYKTSLFKHASIERMAQALSLVFHAVCDDPDRDFSKIDLLPEQIRHQLLQHGKGTALRYETASSLAKEIEKQVTETPNAEAVRCEDLVLSYARFNQQANKLARALDELGVEKGECVGLYLERSIAFSIALLAVQKLGAIYVVLPTGNEDERVQGIIGDAQIATVLQVKTDGLAALAGVDTIYLDGAEHDDNWLAEYPDQNLVIDIQPQDIAYVLYTSGSTGKPKGVQVTQQGLLDYCQLSAQQHYRGVGSIVATATTFDLSIPGLYVPLLRGGCVNLLSANDELSKLMAMLSKPGLLGHFIRLTPSHLQGLLTLLEPKQLLGSHVFVIGGERFELSLAASLQEKFPNAQIYNHYGPTETVVGALCYDVTANLGNLDSQLPIGKPLPNTHIYILDDKTQLVPLGVPGEIYIGGPRVAKGYLNQAELTAERFIDDPFIQGARLYRTGDKARWMIDGNIEFLGRMDDQVKIRGYRIELGEIEQQLLKHPQINSCVAHVWHDEQYSQLVAYVTVSGDVESQVLLAFLQGKLPHYMVPSHIMCLDTLPLSANGKLNRKKLPPPQIQSEHTGVFSTPTEVNLAAIWQQALNVEHISPQDDFFALGGHSLIATRVVSDIAKHFNKPITVAEFFECRTLQNMASFIDAKANKDFKNIPTRDTLQPIALSFAQQRLWFIDQLEHGSTQYNMPIALQLAGTLDVVALESALAYLVSRHEILRTCYRNISGTVSQVIQQDINLYVYHDDLSALPEYMQQQRLVEIETNEWLTSFDLQRDLMIRTKLVKLNITTHVLFITLHHIASDGWSNGLLVKEFVQLYEHFHLGVEVSLPPLPIQYSDYAMWQRQQLSEQELDKQLDYWTQQLADLPTVHNLPLDKPRPKQQQFAAQSFTVTLDKERLGKLHQVALNQGATLFMLLEAVFASLISRFSGDDDIVIGTPISGRNHKDVEPLIGLFVNTLLLRTDLSGDPTFVELLEQSKQTSLAAYANQDVPFDMLVDKLNPERKLNHAALFQILFSMRNNEQVELSLPELEISDIVPAQEQSKFDLQLSATELPDGLELSWRFAVSIFELATIERLSEAYCALLQACAEHPEITVKSVPILASAHLAKVQGWEQGQVKPADLLLPHAFERQVSLTPDQFALSDASLELSYAALNEQANRLAHYLMAQQVSYGDTVALLLTRSSRAIVSILAVLKTGAAYVPIDTNSPTALIENIIKDSGSCCLLTDVPDNPIDQHLINHVIDMRSINLHAYSHTNPHVPQLDGDTLAYVIYTSGSTGQPKGVMVAHSSLANLTANLSPALVDGGVFGGCWGLNATYAFDSSIKALVQLAHGGEIYVMADHERLNTDVLRSLLLNRNRPITTLDCTPTLLDVWLGQGLEAHLPHLVIGGEAISISLWQRLVRWQTSSGKKALNVYGPTECTVDTTWSLIEGDHPVIGQPLNNVYVRVLDDALNRVPIGVFGQLYIGGAGVACGYINQTNATAKHFIQDPDEPAKRIYKTGDKVRWLTSGSLEFLGRFDDQVKIRGYRIELAHIQQQLLLQEQVTDALVRVVQTSHGEQLVAYLIVADPQLDSQDILQHLALYLPSYMLPSALIILTSFPLTRNGKVDHTALPIPDLTEPTSKFEPVITQTEKALLPIWLAVLDVEQVGRNSGFFALGGHSILAIKLVSEIAKVFGKLITVRDVFEHQRLQDLATLLDTQKVEYQQHISVIEKDGPLILSYAQQRIWFIDQLENGSTQYNITIPVKLLGTLCVDGLKQALLLLVQRHEILRTVYLQNEDGAYQKVNPVEEVVVDYEDITYLDSVAKNGALHQAVSRETALAFDLSADLMIRVRLMKLAEGEHALLFTVHHIATDGWSNSILLKDFATLYQQHVEHHVPQGLAELPIQYADFAFWQRTYFSDERLNQQLDYWKLQLAGLPTLHALPTDYPRPAQQKLGAKRHVEVLDTSTLESLHGLAKRYNCTLFTLIHAAFSALLGRISGEDDIVIGTPIAGRNHNEIQSLIGCFINTLVLRANLAQTYTFESLLLYCKTLNLDAMSNQDLPFDLLVDELNPERSLSHAPLFQVLLSMQNYEQQSIELPNLQLQTLFEHDVQSKFDIQLVVAEVDGQLRLTWLYASALFHEQTIVRFAQALTRIFKQVAQKPDLPISKLSLFDEGSDCALAAQVGVREYTNRQYTLIDHIESQVLKTPEHIAISSDVVSLTYAQLNSKANRLAHALLALGVRPQQTVGVCLARSAELLIALLAIQKVAATYVMLSTGVEHQRLVEIMLDANIDVVLHDGHSLASLSNRVRLFSLEDAAIHAQWGVEYPQTNPEVVRDLQYSAYILYTSGSTGKPKGVEISQYALNDYCQLSSTHHYPGDGSVVASAPVFDLTIPGLYVPLLNGGCVHLLAEGNELLDLAEFFAQNDEQALLVRLTPSHVLGLLPLIEQQQFTAKHKFVIGGERFAPSVAKRLQRSFVNSHIINHYGPTETVVGALSFDVTANIDSLGVDIPIGKPLPNTEVMILDISGSRVPTGLPGELYIATPRVARGYLNNAQLTESVFLDNPFNDFQHNPDYQVMYRTGDKVRQLEDGNIVFMGRLDRQVKIRGFRVELGEIEQQLIAFNAVEQGVVKVFGNAESALLVAYVVVKASFDESEFLAFLRERLPGYMVPTSVQVLDKLPLNNNGKVNLHALPKPQQNEQEYTTAQTETEHQLVKIWQTVLQIDALSTSANFFSLGGNSLLGTRVINAVQKEFEIELPLRHLFEQSDIRSIATLVEALVVKKRNIQMALAEEQKNMEETEW